MRPKRWALTLKSNDMRQRPSLNPGPWILTLNMDMESNEMRQRPSLNTVLFSTLSQLYMLPGVLYSASWRRMPRAAWAALLLIMSGCMVTGSKWTWGEGVRGMKGGGAGGRGGQMPGEGE